MNVEDLRRFSDFRLAERDVLATVLKHSREVVVAADRCVLAQRRQLPGRFYLVAGCVRTTQPQAVFDHRSKRAAERLYPGVGSIRTCEVTRLLQVDWDRIAFLFDLDRAPGVSDVRESWEARFLGSPMMQLLTTQEWQTLLVGLSPRTYEKGAVVVRQGESADCCFVLENGHAVVHRGRRTLAYLSPGDFFGEDALVTGLGRNATVTMLEPGSALALPRPLFNDLLLKSLVEYTNRPGRGLLVNIGLQPVVDAINVSTETLRQQLHRFGRGQQHFVVGGNEAQRALAALMLCQAGFKALAVAD